MPEKQPGLGWPELGIVKCEVRDKEREFGKATLEENLGRKFGSGDYEE